MGGFFPESLRAMGWINLFTVTALLIQITTTKSQSESRCFPTDWSHAWSRFGSVWYTILHSAGPFFEKEKQCRMIEHGRTQMGRITSQGEQNHVHIMFSELSPKQDLWLGGMRLAEGEFYWFRQKDEKRNSIEMEKVKKAYWTKGNP